VNAGVGVGVSGCRWGWVGVGGAGAGLEEKKTDAYSLLFRVGQNRIYTPYMTVYLMISLPNIPYIHRIYMVLANPNKRLVIGSRLE